MQVEKISVLDAIIRFVSSKLITRIVGRRRVRALARLAIFVIHFLQLFPTISYNHCLQFLQITNLTRRAEMDGRFSFQNSIISNGLSLDRPFDANPDNLELLIGI